MPAISPIRRLPITTGLLAVALASGCSTSSVELPPVEPEPESQVLPLPRDWIPVVRYGRYALVELAPQVAQKNLLLQVVDVSIPATLQAAVGDALRHLLQRSGYSLCDNNPIITALYDLPLPAAHRQLGPLALRDALLTLAGPAWDLQVDGVARQVCFVRAAPDSTPSNANLPLIEPVQTVSAMDGGQP